jgi:hypothetical protein
MDTGVGKLLLGRGSKMSIPKAAIVWFYEGYKYVEKENLQPAQWNLGDYGAAHEIVEIAGAKHGSVRTNRLVSDALSRSALWNKRRIWGLYSGFRGNTANPNSYTPSEKGERWYREVFLKTNGSES